MNAKCHHHFAFIREVCLQPDRSYGLEVYTVLSFTNTGGALPTYNGMSNTAVRHVFVTISPITVITSLSQLTSCQLQKG
jgi:hypothetical protein